MTIIIVSNASKHKYFIEYIECLLYYSKILFNRPCKYVHYDTFRFEKDAIYIAVQTIPPFLLSSNNVILLQTEQCSRENIRKLLTTTKTPIIDYSKSNISYLPNHHCLYLPLYPRLYRIPPQQPLYDVIMIGAPSPRRKHIWNQVIRLFPRSHFITNNLFDPYDKMKYILQHRVLLNIHYAEDYKIWEEFRCVPAIFHQMIVLSEESVLCSDHPLLEYTIFTKYIRIINALSEIMSDPTYFKNHLFQDFDANKIQKRYNDIYDAFQKEWSRLTLSSLI